MNFDLSPTLIALLAFGAVAAIVFVVGQLLTTQARVQQRVGAPVTRSGGAATNLGFADSFDSLVKTYFDEKRFGVEGSMRAKLRRDLVRAGYFSPNALNYYIFARLAAVVVLPAIAYAVAQIYLVTQPWYVKLFMVAIAMMIGVFGADAF